ncbi:MarR family winged helix-turn-helix transcriptional regulator [Phenylobacterium sp. LjRoot164]|uniref:MarR family winged helix-turn-helix transcriptional regulator n=1 Tax=unclassified Phenylobacterium TaxID=2640670 RepID=UPI003ED02A61
MSERFEPRRPGVDYGVLDELVGYGLRRAQIRMTEAFDARLGPEGVTTQRFSALALIDANPGLKQTELAAIMGIARSGALAIVDALAAQDLIERRPVPGDGRAHALHLTDHGRTRLPQIVDLVRAHDRDLTEGFTADEVTTLRALLERIRT